MAEERKDSFAETVDTAASAAHTVKGAIKAGKAISGAAKGAAAGGPYGAVAGAVWAGRKHIGKIVAVIVILLLLPVLFVLMLPGLIFGGLINAFSPADTEQPVLNSETAIVGQPNILLPSVYFTGADLLKPGEPDLQHLHVTWPLRQPQDGKGTAVTGNQPVLWPLLQLLEFASQNGKTVGGFSGPGYSPNIQHFLIAS